MGFFTCTQILMHANVYGDCTNTARESALEVYSGRKSLVAPPGNWICVISVPDPTLNQLRYMPKINREFPKQNSWCSIFILITSTCCTKHVLGRIVPLLEIFLSRKPFLLAASFLHLHLSLNRRDRFGTTDDFTTSFLHFFLFSTALWDFANSGPVISLKLSSHLFFSCLPCLLSPFTVPSKMVLARLGERETRSYHFSLRLITMVRFSCGPIACWIPAQDFIIGNMVFVWDAWYLLVPPYFHGSYSSLRLCCEGSKRIFLYAPFNRHKTPTPHPSPPYKNSSVWFAVALFNLEKTTQWRKQQQNNQKQRKKHTRK